MGEYIEMCLLILSFLEQSRQADNVLTTVKYCPMFFNFLKCLMNIREFGSTYLASICTQWESRLANDHDCMFLSWADQ